MEKAFAKFNVNYDNIQGGTGYESLRWLTNKPVFRFDHASEREDMEAAWNKFHELAGRNYPSTTACCNNPPDGIVSGHAYTLVGTAEVSDGGQTYRLVKLRNPWASEMYYGDWSDSSSLWTDSLKEQAGWTRADDGIFFMAFDMFMERLEATQFAVYEDFAYSHKWSFSQRSQWLDIEINNPVRQKLYLTVETLSPRMSPYTCTPDHWVNLYLNDPSGRQIGDIGYIGWLFFHATLGTGPLYDNELDAGTYTL